MQAIYTGLEHTWNPSANKRFKTPEGAYLGMNYESFKSLRGRKKVISGALIGSYIQLKGVPRVVSLDFLYALKDFRAERKPFVLAPEGIRGLNGILPRKIIRGLVVGIESTLVQR